MIFVSKLLVYIESTLFAINIFPISVTFLTQKTGFVLKLKYLFLFYFMPTFIPLPAARKIDFVTISLSVVYLHVNLKSLSLYCL